MARTNAQKRASRLEAQREHQATRRQRMAVEGKPDTSKIDAAIIEATAFAIAHDALSARAADARPGHVSIERIITTAVTILSDREGYDRRHSKIGVGRRLKMRDDHRDPSFIPSLNADPVAQAARMVLINSPPLPPQTRSSGAE